MTTTPPEGAPDPVLGFTRGDRIAAAELRQAFTQIGEHHPDPEVARVARQVLAGRLTVRDAVRDPAFQSAMSTGITRFAERWDELSDAERREMLAAGPRARQDLARDLDDDPGPDEVEAFERPGSDRLRVAYERLVGPLAPDPRQLP